MKKSLVLTIVAVVVGAGLYWWGEAKNPSTGSGGNLSSTTHVVPIPHYIEKHPVSVGERLHLDIPDGYKLDAVWDEPMDVRSSSREEWIVYGEGPLDVDLGENSKWQEFRLSNSATVIRADVICEFTYVGLRKNR